jgi:hypothetical protein
MGRDNKEDDIKFSLDVKMSKSVRREKIMKK